jgi:hypothetical protein
MLHACRASHAALNVKRAPHSREGNADASSGNIYWQHKALATLARKIAPVYQRGLLTLAAVNRAQVTPGNARHESTTNCQNYL